MRRLLSVAIFLFLLGISVPAVAAMFNIPVTANGDRVDYQQWYSGGSDSWSNVGANPNQVSHDYFDGSGSSASTALSFNLSSIKGKVTKIASATINFNILSIWTQGRNDVGNLNNIGTVFADGGTGWKSFDITQSLQNALDKGAATADYYFSYTGYSGFTFGSAEGQDPAFIQIKTLSSRSANRVVPTPIPAAAWLLGSGLLGLVGIRRRIKA
jgi:hypothetical protein